MSRIELTFGGNEFDIGPDDAILFTFIGSLAVHNHIWVTTDQEENKGFYIPWFSPAYEQMAPLMEEHRYPAVLNQREVPDCDREGIEAAIQANMYDLYGREHFPKEWE